MEVEKLEIKNFGDLSLKELYDLLALRTNVFVVEQECAYPELDYHDQAARHVLLYRGAHLAAYARISAPGTVYRQLSIGRVAVSFHERGRGLGRQVFTAAVKEVDRAGPQTLKIQAQTYLIDFYRSFGFRAVTEEYPDYGIMHVDMIREPAEN